MKINVNDEISGLKILDVDYFYKDVYHKKKGKTYRERHWVYETKCLNCGHEKWISRNQLLNRVRNDKKGCSSCVLQDYSKRMKPKKRDFSQISKEYGAGLVDSIMPPPSPLVIDLGKRQDKYII